MLKYLRVRIFSACLRPFSKRTRQNRMALFVKVMKPDSDMKILDLGGQPEIWDFVDTPLDITCLNLPGISTKEHRSHHRITYVEGDACNMPYFEPGDFDLIFSNSVIEHVGDHERRQQFCREILRLSKTYWIQTPSKWFPIEAHCGMPFWWFYPQVLRAYFLRRWEKKLPDWTEMVAGTSIISASELRNSLPGCTIHHEWFWVPKSLVAYSKEALASQSVRRDGMMDSNPPSMDNNPGLVSKDAKETIP